MDKLVERESATRNPLVAAPALAVQFFLIPLVVVSVAVGVYVGFRSLMADSRTPQDYLNEIRTGGMERQWPAAYELSRLMDDPKVRGDKSLARELVKAFDEAKAGDPRVRKYLALAIGRLDPPLPADAVAILLKSLDDPEKAWTPDLWSRINGWTAEMNEAHISTIWALGASGSRAWRPGCSRSMRLRTPAFARSWSTRSARCQATRKSTRCARRFRTPRPTCAGTPRSRSRATTATKGWPCCARCSIGPTSSRRSSATSDRTTIRIRSPT